MDVRARTTQSPDSITPYFQLETLIFKVDQNPISVFKK